MTEKEMLAALFIAVAALGEKLTGEKMSVSITDRNGDVISICGSEYAVTWTAAGKPERVSRATIREVRAKPPPVQQELNRVPEVGSESVLG